MPDFASFVKFIARIERQSLKITDKVIRESQDDAANLLIDYASTGPFSLAELARSPFNHPFSKAHPNPILEPFIINMQSGAFIQSWKQEGTDTSWSIWNEDETEKQYISRALDAPGGTSRMVERPLLNVLPDMEVFVMRRTDRLLPE